MDTQASSSYRLNSVHGAAEGRVCTIVQWQQCGMTGCYSGWQVGTVLHSQATKTCWVIFTKQRLGIIQASVAIGANSVQVQLLFCQGVRFLFAGVLPLVCHHLAVG